MPGQRSLRKRMVPKAGRYDNHLLPLGAETSDGSTEKRKDSPAAMGECYCSQLFKLEQTFAELTPEERYKKRLEQEKPVLDALLSWANEIQAKAAPKSALGKAIHYLLEQWPYLTRYLEDGRLELSNNRAERSIKPFVMGQEIGSSPIRPVAHRPAP